jgi:cyclic-di-GMP-binding protein
MASFDIVSEVNVQEVDNAVNQAQKEIQSRYDFKAAKFELEFDKLKCQVKLSADEDSRLEALYEVLTSKLFKRGVELGSLEVGKVELMGGMTRRQIITIRQGLETDKAKAVVKIIKDAKLKVDAAIQEKQVRVSAKKIDDLQQVIALLRSSQGQLGVPLQYVNMRS